MVRPSIVLPTSVITLGWCHGDVICLIELACYFPDPRCAWNVGDNFVAFGAEYLLEQVGERTEVVYYDWNSPIAKQYSQRLSEDPDTICITGSPWFWDLCDRSEKYRWLEEQVWRTDGTGKMLIANPTR